MANLNHLRSVHLMDDAPVGYQQTSRVEDGTDGINYDTQSIQSALQYNQSAIGEMNFDELDQLRSKNEKRMKEIEEKYFTSRNEIKTYKEVMTELKEDWTTKEGYKDSSTSYPCYGRGLHPNINMNTFMIQEKMTG
jgi:hypothetical protein